MLRFHFQCHYELFGYCHDGSRCSGCSDRDELLRVVRETNLPEALSLVFVDMVIGNRLTAQTADEVRFSIEDACDNLLDEYSVASNTIRDWCKDNMW